MAKLTRKCQYCKLDDTNKDEMTLVVVDSGKKPINKFYHNECYEKFLKEKEFKDKEREELDNLAQVVMKIYGVKILPKNVYPYLQDLRNGTRFFGRDKKKYKEGYSYDLIAETFEHCSETIEFWNGRKSFDSLSSAIRYGLAIVCDKLHFVEQRRNRREEQRKRAEIHANNAVENIISNDANDEAEKANGYKKPKKNVKDFTDFLDD